MNWSLLLKELIFFKYTLLYSQIKKNPKRYIKPYQYIFIPKIDSITGLILCISSIFNFNFYFNKIDAILKTKLFKTFFYLVFFIMRIVLLFIYLNET